VDTEIPGEHPTDDGMKRSLILLTLVPALTALTAQSHDQLQSDHPQALTSPGTASPGSATEDEKTNEAELAKKLQNPIANLISVPVQNNWDFGIGPANAMRYTANVQPVIPFTLTEDWNLITRTILPVIFAESPVKGGRDASGLGDVVQSFFLSPKDPLGGWIVGGGPVFLWPTATDSVLGSGKWGAGPTLVALRQEHGWTYGALANQIWSYHQARGSNSITKTIETKNYETK